MTTIAERAGTQLDHRYAVKVYALHHGRRVQRGTIDPRHRVYQCGGNLNDFVFWLRQVVAFDAPVWEQLVPAIAMGVVEVLEVVDHGKNVVYVADAEEAVANAEPYVAPGAAAVKDRVGVPLELFGIFNAHWEVVAPFAGG